MPDSASPAPHAVFSLAQLAALAHLLPTGFAAHDGDRAVLINRAMCELTGYSQQEMLAMKFWEIFHPRLQDRIRQIGRERMQGAAAPSFYEVELLTAQGELRYVDLFATVIMVDGQRIALGNFIDTTQRKRAEALQQQAQQLLSQIIDSTPVPTFVIDRDHVITHWNRACEETLGLKAAAMVGTRRQQKVFYGRERLTMADLIVDGGDVAHVKELYGEKRLARSPLISGAYEAEDFFPTIGDHGAWLYFSAAPLTDAEGNVMGAVETLQDITERRIAESELIRSRQQLVQLAAARGEQLSKATQELELDIARRREIEAELLERVDQLSALNAELQQAQRQLVQSEKLASIGQLAAGVAHEINNPIAFVNSNLGALQRYTRDLMALLDAYREGQARWCTAASNCAGGSEWRERTERLAGDIELDYLKSDLPLLLKESKEGIARVSQIVADLRDFSRIDTEHQWEWSDLRKGLDSTLNIVANEVRYRAEVVKDYGELPPIKCLPAQLNQVFMNLLVNAAQAMPEGRHGTITLRCGSERGGVWVEIADTGSGIPADKLGRIFDPFFTTKPVGKGTGLGLSLSYGIVQKHGGRIEVTTEIGVGTTFRVSLPIEPPASQQDADAVSRAPTPAPGAPPPKG